MFPEDDYLARIGRALYANNYLEWLIIEVIGLLGSTKSTASLASMQGGNLLRALQQSIGLSSIPDAALRQRLEDLARDYDLLIDERNDIAHARPATTPDDLPRLYRWAPKRTDNTAFISEVQLEGFVERALDLNRRFDEARQTLTH
jgi:hypothetical protein